MSNFSKWTYQPFFIKIFTFATGSDEDQKLFLRSSIDGDVAEFVVTGFNSRRKYKWECNRFKQMVSILAERDSKNLFYFTDDPRKGEEAKKAGLTVFVVLREGNKYFSQEKLTNFTVINSFDQLDFWPFQ